MISCTFANSPHPEVCRHRARRHGVTLKHPRATHPCFLRMLSYVRIHWPSAGGVLVPRGFPSPGAGQRVHDGPLGLSLSPRGSFSGRFPGCANPPTQPLLMLSLTDFPQALREERPPPQLLADLRGHHEEAWWETTLGKGTDGPAPLVLPGCSTPSLWWLLLEGGVCSGEGVRGGPPHQAPSPREVGASRRCNSPVCSPPWARKYGDGGPTTSAGGSLSTWWWESRASDMFLTDGHPPGQFLSCRPTAAPERTLRRCTQPSPNSALFGRSWTPRGCS